MNGIRKAERRDSSRIAEISVFTKRMNYRSIFHNDKVSFGELQVLPLAQSYLADGHGLDGIWVYEEDFVKGFLHVEKQELVELYVDSFFQSSGIGGKLMEFAVGKFDVNCLWVLKKNERAVSFYKKHGFELTGEQRLEEGTTEYSVEMMRR